MRRPRAGPAALQQCGEDVDDGAERAGREVGGLHGGYPGSGVGERARPAHVVEVVACAPGMPALVPETRDRADDGRLGNPEPQPLEHPGPEAVEDHVGLVAELLGDGGARRTVPRHDLLARVDRVVPRRRAVLHRVALRRLHLDDARAQPHAARGSRTAPAAGV